MDAATPAPDTFLLFVVLPMLVGAVAGALTDRQSAVRGVMIGGIAGALIGYFGLILLSEAG